MSQSLNGPAKGIAAIFDRFSNWLGAMLTCLDQLAAVWLRGFGYVWFGGELPSADETISAWVGRNAIAGNRAALIAEKVIDFLMTQPGHCRRAIARDDED
jgi:hypothetical protein